MNDEPARRLDTEIKLLLFICIFIYLFIYLFIYVTHAIDPKSAWSAFRMNQSARATAKTLGHLQNPVIYWAKQTSQNTRTQLLLIPATNNVSHPNRSIEKLLEKLIHRS